MRYLTLFLFLLYSAVSNAQVFTIDQLLLLSKKSPDQAETYLLSKGWEQAPSDDTVQVWAYDRQPGGGNMPTFDEAGNMKPSPMSYQAKAWIHLCWDSSPFVSYSLNSGKRFAVAKQRLLALGYKQSTKQRTEKKITSIYKLKGVRVELMQILGMGMLEDEVAYLISISR